MRKVVIPTDFSENAFNALKYACQIFKYERCEFYILHAYADEVYHQDSQIKRSFLDELKEVIFKKSEQELERLLKKIREHSPNPDHEYKTISAFGTLTDEINDLVNQENMDIVVMGTRGKTDDRKITFGSNTVQVLKYVHCPVLAVPSKYKYKSLKNILFPTNYLIPYKRRELKLLCEMSASFRATIHMLYINPIKKISLRQEDNQEILKGCLNKPTLLFKTSKGDDRKEVITNYVKEQQMDMLVMVNSRHSHLDDMLFPSTIDLIGLQIKIPFLVLQNLSREY